MTFPQRLRKRASGLLMVIVVWLALMAWDARGAPPREELADMAHGFGFACALLLVVESVIHLVRRRSRI